MCSIWSQSDLAGLNPGPGNYLPMLTGSQASRTLPGCYLWDFWPIKNGRDEVAVVGGQALWLCLSAPDHFSPDERHHYSRIRLLGLSGDTWADLGLLFRGQDSFGDHEWTGSANLDEASGCLQLFYTAVGRLGDNSPSYEQRLVAARGKLTFADGKPGFSDWTGHRECVAADGSWYAIANEKTGRPGFIKAFRDPCWFRDPLHGQEYLVFSASVAGAVSEYRGSIGLAKSSDSAAGGWELCPPLFAAEGVNNELERAHLVYHGDRYYLFWSTQESTFAADCRGPTGLYGACAEALTGPYRLLNGSGLVVANPPESPGQCYAWQVLEDLSVVSFVNSVPAGAPGGFEFIGGAAPLFQLVLDGDRAQLAR